MEQLAHFCVSSLVCGFLHNLDISEQKLLKEVTQVSVNDTDPICSFLL